MGVGHSHECEVLQAVAVTAVDPVDLADRAAEDWAAEVLVGVLMEQAASTRVCATQRRPLS